ncbi:site-2 protease family protein [Actinomycetospora cinnamomea]|uniref:Zn-dependent protease n=1 Tax=Actinomycetospora cinnamomea TaxID=663609 RepID=A0A2U1FRW4_9PSEU|nr:site-2 protease family protein [Actinomycetospora cinnamomea]PVZ14908.1 Zn-dependent protease [Actinomycetospora cinnamomea]
MAPPVSRLRSPVSPIFLVLVALTVAGGALTLVPARGAVVGGTVLLVLAGWAVSLCLHEFSHALTADRCGDHSVRDRGYLTLDIRRYANIGLTLVLPLLFLLIGGIPLPGGAVWIQRAALRSRVAISAVSLAGPLANLLLAAVIAIGIALTAPPLPLAAALAFLGIIQVLTFVLNVLPIPGLDGWGVIDPYLPWGTRTTAARVAPYAPFAIILLIFLLPGASALLFAVSESLWSLVGGDGTLARLGNVQFARLLG